MATKIQAGLQANDDNINFILDSAAFDASFTALSLDISGDVALTDETQPLIRAKCSKSDWHACFRFSAKSGDGGDGVDLNATNKEDVVFYHATDISGSIKDVNGVALAANQFLARLANQDASSNHTESDLGKYLHHGTTGEYQNGSKLETDILRTISKHVFHTVHGVDLFANESSLLSDIQTVLNTTSKDALFAPDANPENFLGIIDGSYNIDDNYNTDTATSLNTGSTIFNVIAKSKPGRFSATTYESITDVSLSDISSSDGIPLPIKPGDKFYVKVTMDLADVVNPITTAAFKNDNNATHDYTNTNKYLLEIEIIS